MKRTLFVQLALALLVPGALMALPCNDSVESAPLSAARMSASMGVIAAEDDVHFTWKLNPKSVFVAIHTFDSVPSQPCTVTLWARYVINGNASSLKKIATARNVRKQNVRFLAQRMPGISRARSGSSYYHPVVNFATRSTCGSNVTVSSSPVARYANCGYRSRKLRVSSWLSDLQTRLK